MSVMTAGGEHRRLDSLDELVQLLELFLCGRHTPGKCRRRAGKRFLVTLYLPVTSATLECGIEQRKLKIVRVRAEAETHLCAVYPARNHRPRRGVDQSYIVTASFPLALLPFAADD